MKSDIIVHLKTHATVTIECNNNIAKELSQYFSSYAPNYRFAPAYKNGSWNGQIKFFQMSTNELPIGLVDKLHEFAKKGNYTIECNYKRHNNITREELQKFIDKLNIPFELRDYQFEAAYQCIRDKHLNVQASTSSGKSVIIYVVIRFMTYMKLKSIIIVPSIMLVEQMYNDFISYGWNAEKYCAKIYGGQKKYFDVPVVIACWASMVTTKVREMNVYEHFNCMITDEAHGCSRSVMDLAKVCINAEYRCGFSGTYPEPSVADWYSITGSTGTIKTFATYKKLEADGYITPLKINNVILKYDNDFKKQVYLECGSDYNLQNDMIHKNEKRNQFILKLVQNLKENTLVLFTKKENHGHIMRELLERELKDKTILYIDGDTPEANRNASKKLLETRDDIVLLASYGIFSTGISVNNLHNLVFASSYKSKTKILQSCGRVLRLNENKTSAKLYDIIDDLSFIDKKNSIKFVNHALNHYKERKQFYTDADWTCTETIFPIL